MNEIQDIEKENGRRMRNRKKQVKKRNENTKEKIKSKKFWRRNWDLKGKILMHLTKEGLKT